jgi:hypothetical protein
MRSMGGSWADAEGFVDAVGVAGRRCYGHVPSPTQHGSINSAGRGPVQSDLAPNEDQDLLCLPRGCLGQRREQHRRAHRWHR